MIYLCVVSILLHVVICMKFMMITVEPVLEKMFCLLYCNCKV